MLIVNSATHSQKAVYWLPHFVLSVDNTYHLHRAGWYLQLTAHHLLFIFSLLCVDNKNNVGSVSIRAPPIRTWVV